MLVAMLLVALANFPFHVALIAYPWLIFLSGVLARDGACRMPATPNAGLRCRR